MTNQFGFGHLWVSARLARGVILFFSLCVILGCAAKRVVLAPAPNATLATLPNSAKGSDQGVLMVVQAEAWNGRPRNLDTKVTPLKVTIKNNSGHPLAIRYKDFVLVSADDHRYADIPPYQIKGTSYGRLQREPQYVPASYIEPARFAELQTKPASGDATPAPQRATPSPTGRTLLEPDFDSDDYYIAPWWGYAYPGLGFWPYAWGPPDWTYYDQYYPYLRQIHLPTRSMLRKAIPEGVVANGGRISGFLYFQKPDHKRTSDTITFDATLVDAQTGQTFGQLAVSFEERSQ